MRTLMSGAARVDYGQLYVESGEQSSDLGECFGGQVNGLCGGAVPGTLFLMAGTNVGEVHFTVELHDQPPPVGAEWEDVVEVSFRPSGPVALYVWAHEDFWSLDELEPIDYRVRYCAVGMDEAREVDSSTSSRDRYVLQFWPAPPEPDRIVRQTSEHAAYWHAYARKQPPPPTPEEKAEAERLAREKRERAAAQARLEAEEREWGGRLPGERLRQLRGSALNLAPLDRPLVDALAEAEPTVQRQVARWAIRRAFTEGGLADIDWIAPALAAMDRGEPLPPPFEDDRRPWDLLFADERVPQTVVTTLNGVHDNFSQQAMALPAIFAELEQDPLVAAFDAVWSAVATYGRGRHGELLAELRSAFPVLG
ncbi:MULTISPECIES: hypothetical protein [Saccharothrix]|uniref:hypothetical protein n=1 Tax=Saccharothrix TaxID=2071 RepID=UPI00093A9E54|nr:hypothetical protein [Saccharothrix sp. CB00851]OKI24999.1 hypothetical protein A6A25_33990 [Saccharothrix sp. CB00851]